MKIVNFLYSFLTNIPDATLSEMQFAIWKNRKDLLPETANHPPSQKWIHCSLVENLITYKFGAIDPHNRNTNEVRLSFVLTLAFIVTSMIILSLVKNSIFICYINFVLITVSYVF